jgi:hypothetical protein
LAELKTRLNEASVDAFLRSIPDEERRRDCRQVAAMMRRITRAKPKMWGTSIVGFGSYHYRYETGREGDWFLTGFSPRKQDLTLYVMAGFVRHDSLLKKLGKHKTGKSCLYIKRLADVDAGVLEALVSESVKQTRKTWGKKAPRKEGR